MIWKNLVIIFSIIDIAFIIYLLFFHYYSYGICVIYGWNDRDDFGNPLYTITAYNLTTEKTISYIIPNEADYNQTFNYSHIKLSRQGLFGKWCMEFIPYEDVLCKG